MADEYPTVRAAAVQAASVFLDREATVDKACDLIAEAGQSGADVTVFPEGFVPGHPLWYHFHPATSEVSERLATRLFRNAVEVPGPATRRLARATEEADTYVVMGVCEKEPDTTGTMYNSQLFFSPDGELVGKHQKIKPTTGEQLVHAEGKRDTFGTVPTDYGPISGLICGENSNPLAVGALAAAHTRIHSMSWPPNSKRTRPGVRLSASRAFAQMSKAYVVSANGIVDERTIDAMELDDEDAEGLRTLENAGESMIVAPNLEVVAGPLMDGEGILYADLDLELGIVRKLTHDFAGHYNRPDMFQLRIDRNPPELVADSPLVDGLEPASSDDGRAEEPAVDVERDRTPTKTSTEGNDS